MRLKWNESSTVWFREPEIEIRDLERPTVIGFKVYEFREVHLETAEAKKKTLFDSENPRSRLKIWKGRQWSDLQCINLEKDILKQQKQNKNVQSKTDKRSMLQTFAVFKLFHEHKINDKCCNGKRLRSCKDIIHFWQWIRTWMWSLVKNCHSFYRYKTIFKHIISHSICML